MKHEIDIVVTWVDDTDPAWRNKRARYVGEKESDGNTAARYRDWGTLKYWFRGVERFAPWVRNVYFVTDDQKPEWLNLEHPKLRWIKHTDFIPKEYLPTFSSDAIEWNLHRIEELSENFVYFNDDFFLIGDTKPEDFFTNGVPCDYPCIGVQYATGLFSHMLFNNNEMLNRNFSFKDCVKANLTKWTKLQSAKGLLKLFLYGRESLFPGSNHHHIPISFCKSTFEIMWEKEFEVIHKTCINKLRCVTDVTTFSVRDWQLLSGNFYPHKPLGRLFHTASLAESDEALEYIRNQRGKVICLNDGENEANFEEHKRKVLAEFERLLPNRSDFELEN